MMPKPIEIYVSPQGDDRGPGTLAEPVAGLPQAVKLMRQKRRAKSSPCGGRIVLRRGTHRLFKPLVLTAKDSGIAPTAKQNTETDRGQPLVFTAYPGEQATISGGQRITGWKPTQVHGQVAWEAAIPGVKTGRSNFHQFWVNGRRADRTRLPDQNMMRIEKPLNDPKRTASHPHPIFRGHLRFKFAPGDLLNWKNFEDVQMVALHFWLESRMTFKSIDVKRRIAELAHRPRMALTDDHTKAGAPYYIENVYEALQKPGQWYLDRPAGQVIYLPREGESIETVEAYAPAVPTLIQMDSTAMVRFENLTFSHNEYHASAEKLAAPPQAACHVGGAMVLHQANRCTIDRCTFEHLGSYGIEILGGSRDCVVTRCLLRDLGAGGIKVFHPESPDAPSPVRITLSHNEITDGGHYNRQAVGVLVGRCSGVQVVHNHIHQFDYSGISVGWTWGYAESGAYGNLIESNHIHDIGRGVLSDMGGIYLLGVSPGTRVRYNRIHDVQSRGYGGWGIYADEGSTAVLIENNLVYRTKSSGFHQHYGRTNQVRNNIFAFGGQGQLRISRVEMGHVSGFFHHNILLGDQPDMWYDKHEDIISGVHTQDTPADHLVTDHNLYFNLNSKSTRFADLSWYAWKKLGFDRHSLVADPGFKNPQQGDFTLKRQSPALKLGFVPFDLSHVGPRDRAGAPKADVLSTVR